MGFVGQIDEWTQTWGCAVWKQQSVYKTLLEKKPYSAGQTARWPSVRQPAPEQTMTKCDTTNVCSPFGLVQAPNRLTTFRWFPMWIRIFSSDIKALCSLAVAPSERHAIIFIMSCRSRSHGMYCTCRPFPLTYSSFFHRHKCNSHPSASWQPLCPNCCSYWCHRLMPRLLSRRHRGLKPSLCQEEEQKHSRIAFVIDRCRCGFSLCQEQFAKM